MKMELNIKDLLHNNQMNQLNELISSYKKKNYFTTWSTLSNYQIFKVINELISHKNGRLTKKGKLYSFI